MLRETEWRLERVVPRQHDCTRRTPRLESQLIRRQGEDRSRFRTSAYKLGSRQQAQQRTHAELACGFGLAGPPPHTDDAAVHRRHSQCTLDRGRAEPRAPEPRAPEHSKSRISCARSRRKESRFYCSPREAARKKDPTHEGASPFRLSMLPPRAGRRRDEHCPDRQHHRGPFDPGQGSGCGGSGRDPVW